MQAAKSCAVRRSVTFTLRQERFGTVRNFVCGRVMMGMKEILHGSTQGTPHS
jgi:hypothetical protein